MKYHDIYLHSLVSSKTTLAYVTTKVHPQYVASGYQILSTRAQNTSTECAYKNTMGISLEMIFYGMKYHDIYNRSPPASSKTTLTCATNKVPPSPIYGQ